MDQKLIGILLFLVLYISSGCAADSRFGKQRATSKTDTSRGFHEGQKLRGVSSYYGKKFHGRQTANGEVFNMYDLTAAHKELPFDTIISVTNLNNNQKVQVRINDRGPFKKNRILDLSSAAAKKIDLVSSGTALVEISILKVGATKK